MEDGAPHALCIDECGLGGHTEHEDFFQDEMIIKGGQEFLKGGQEFLKGGQEFLKGGQEFLKGGQEMFKGGQLQDGDDFARNDVRQKAQVVGRGRMKLMGLETEGPLAMQKRLPLPPWAVKKQFAPRMSSSEFQRKWTLATQDAFESNELLGYEGSAHNLVQGPGRFVWDVRLMKMMPVKERPEQVTLVQALAKLRSLHATLQKAFGPQWISIIQGSTKRSLRKDYLAQTRRLEADETTVADALSLFEPEDLMLRDDIFGEEPNVDHRIQKIVNRRKEPLGFLYASLNEPGLFLDANFPGFQKAQDLGNHVQEIVSRKDDVVVGKKTRLVGGHSLDGGSLGIAEGGSSVNGAFEVLFVSEARFYNIAKFLAQKWPEQATFGLVQKFSHSWTSEQFQEDPLIRIEAPQVSSWTSVGLTIVNIQVKKSSDSHSITQEVLGLFRA